MAQLGYDIVIVGGGHAAAKAAAGARQVNQGATIAILGEERHLPYERPLLSKAGLKTPALLASHRKHDALYYSANRIDLRLGNRANRLDGRRRWIFLASGDRIRYERLIVATGSRLRHLEACRGFANIFYLRTLDEAKTLGERLRPGVRLGVIGGGLIGMEVAATANALGAKVIVFEAAASVMSRVLPPVLAKFIQNHHESKGIRFRLNTPPSKFLTSPTGELVVKVGPEEETFDSVLVGIGAIPNTEIVASSDVDSDDGIRVDKCGRTSDANIFAAGEVTRHPIAGSSQAVRREAWQVAEYQAVCAGRTAGGVPTEFVEIPWVWSDQGALNVQILGTIPSDGEWTVRAEPEKPSFSAFVRRAEIIVGMVAINGGRDISVARKLIMSKARVPSARLSDVSIPLGAFLR